MAQRYGSNGLKYGFIYELDNEPDRGFGTTAADLDDYMALVDAAVTAIRANDPGALIVSGGVTNPAGDGLTFLLGCFDRGLLNKVDGVGIHNYNPSAGANVALRRVPERIVDSVATLRQEFVSRGKPSSFPIAMTEWGADITWFDGPNLGSENEQGQAEVGIRAYLLYQMTDLKLGVYYRWAPDGLGTDQPQFSVKRTKDPFDTRPLYTATQLMKAQLNGYAFEKRYNLGSTDHYALVYKSGSNRKLVVWTKETPKTVSIPVSGGTSPFPTVSLLGAWDTITRSGGSISPNLKTAVLYIDIGTGNVP